MNNNNKPTIIVIFGISGDLAKRYLLSAISAIEKAGMIPSQFHIVGLTRQSNITIDSLLTKNSNPDYIYNHMSLRQINVTDVNDYKKLDEYLDEIEKNFDSKAQRLFYLSVPPKVSKSIVELLGTSGLSKKSNTKLLLEKPFGINLENAVDLVTHINKYFSPSQIYRVDHYMAKETVQNIIVFRQGNSLFKKTWNKDFIDKIEILVSEELGIEGRANFYEQAGALRDMVQSHLLQLLSLTLMKLPDGENLESVPSLRLEALKGLYIKDINQSLRGQYLGYKEEAQNPYSKVETFVSITLNSNDPRWEGVPMTLTTGKALNTKTTEIKISYKKEKDHESNELILYIQPKGGIQFNMWAKHPGYEFKVSPHNLSFKFEEYYGILPEAYEQVLFNAINSDHSLFTSSDEVIETWRILDSLQKTWEESRDEDLIIYKKGSTPDQVISK